MPTYPYASSDGEVIEKVLSFKDKKPKYIDKNGKRYFKKLVFPPVYFRGPGFACSGDHYENQDPNEPSVLQDPDKHTEWKNAKEKNHVDTRKKARELADHVE